MCIVTAIIMLQLFCLFQFFLGDGEQRKKGMNKSHVEGGRKGKKWKEEIKSVRGCVW